MVVFRAVLGLLTVLVFASPAFAQSLQGTWRVRSVAGIQNRGTICAAGSVTFNAAGAVIAPSTLQECDPAVPVMPLVGGSLTVGANSSVSGSIDVFDLQGTFLPAGDAFVAVSTVSPDGAVGFGLAVFVKDTATTFAQGDLAGTWRVHLIDGGELPASITERAFGSIVIGPTGAITGGTLAFFSVEEGESLRQVTGGNATINTDGVITGTVLTIRAPGDTPVTTAFNGLMATDKKLVAGSLRVVDGEAVESGLALLQRQPPSTFATGDIVGQWTLNHVILDAFSSDQATWLRGTVDVNAQGGATGTLLDPSGAALPAFGVFVVDASGLVNGELVTSDPTLGFSIQGTMFDTKGHIIGTDTIFEAGEPDSPGGPFGVGLLSMVRRGAAPTIVQFSQPAYTVRENVANAAITVTRTGTLTGAVTVSYAATPLTAVPNGDFKTVSGVLTFPANVGTGSFNVPILNDTLVDGNRSVMLTLTAPTGTAVLGAPSTATLTIQDDDRPGTFKVDRGTYTVLESAVSLPIIVRRFGTNLAGNVSVQYTTGGGTAISEGDPRDYDGPSGTLSFGAGETAKTVTILIRQDKLVDGDKTFTFSLAHPSSGATLDPQSSALVTIKDVDVAGLLKFAPLTYSVSENAPSVTLTVTRTGGGAGGVLVDFVTTDGTASSEGGDFDFTSGTLTFLPANMSAKIVIPIRQDTRAEGNETFTVDLLNPRGGATLPVTAALGRSATVTIVDDESAFQFSTPTFTVIEGTANAVITVLRTGPLVGQATVNYTATPGTAVAGLDFNPVSGTLTFPANTPSKTFSVPILNDTLLDSNRSVMLGLNTPTGGVQPGGVQLGTVNTAVLTIVDNEQAGQFKLDKTAYTVAETAGFVTITVMRTGTNLVGNVSVTLTATNGSATSGVNYTAPAGALTFATGETSKTVKIPITPDHVVTGPLVFNVALTSPSSGATPGTPATAPVTITNTDVGGQIRLGAATILVAESAGSVTLVVQRTGGLAGNVSIDFTTALIVPASPSTASGADFTAVSGTLTFGFGNTSVSIVIPITRDEVIEPNEAFQVRLANPRGGATLVAPSVATVTIADLESMVQFSGNFLGNFPQVVRTGSLATEVRVDFVATDGTALAGIDYVPLSGTLTFKPNVAVQYIPLTIIGDNIAEGSETFTIALRNPTAPARLGPDSVREFAIADNDLGGNVGFEATLYTATEGGTVEVGIARTGGVGAVLTVQWQAGPGAATPGVDFTPASGSVTFGPNDTRKTFTINALTDALGEDPETVTLALSVPMGAATLGRATTTLQILDAAPVLPVVQFGAPASSTLLGQNALISIVRSGPGTALTVDWMVTGGTATAGQHFAGTSGTVTFAPADTSRTFEVTVLDSASPQPDRTVVYGLGVAPGTATIGAVNSSTLTIFGSVAEINLQSSFYSVTEGGGPAVISVTRSGNLDRQVTVQYATSNGTGNAGTHYTASAGTVTFAIGQESASFTVPIIANGPGDGSRTVNLTLSNPSPNTIIGEVSAATLQIREGPVYSFQLIADNTGPIVGFGGVPSINDGDTVAFKGFLADERQRIFRGNGGPLTTIATTSSQGLVDFGQRVPIDSAGNVAFLGTPAAGGQGIFRGNGGALATLILTDEPIVQLFEPAMSPNGHVAVAGQRPNTGARVLISGPAAGPFVEIPGTGDGTFSDINVHPSVNDDGLVAFVATSESRSIFTVDANGVAATLAEGVDVGTFDNVSVNALGQVAVISELPAPDGLGILVAQHGGAVTRFVTLANGFQAFGDGDADNTPAINVGGEVGFRGLTAETFGILTGPEPIANLVVQAGDPLLGSTVQSLRFGGINGAGKIVFQAGLDDGRQVVVVATPPLVQADLAVTKTVSVASPIAGSNVTFTITARNNGPATATGARVTDLLPTGYTFVAATPSRGTYTSGTGLWTVGTLTASGAGSTATLSIVATVLPTGTYDNTAAISAGGVVDANAANNTATAVVTPSLQADIAIAKTVSNAGPLAGTNITFTLTVTNLGPAAASSAQVTDLLPTGYTFVSATPSQGGYVSTTGVWTVGALAASGAGNSATLQITATVKTTGVYNNTATRTASTPTDPNAANNSATVVVSPVTGLSLSTIGPLVGVGRTITGSVTLPSAAPAGGVNVTLATTPLGIATVAPTTVTINAGATTGAFTVTGVTPGGTTITGTATGFAPGHVSVTTTSSIISLGALTTIGLGQSTSLPINLSTPAPAGGVTVNFASSATNIATVTSNVFIPQGAQVPAANPQVTGVNIGSAQITASAIGFAPDTRSANVSVSVTFTPATLGVVTGTASNITVNISAPAPSAGLTFNLATANTSVATVVSPVTVLAGQTSVQAAVTGRAVAQTTLQASGAGVTSGTATIKVTQPPLINFANQTIGKNLQVQNSLSLAAAAPAGGVQVTLTSSDATKLLLSTSGTVQGSGQVTVSINAGGTTSSTPVFLQALDSTGTPTVTVSAPGYTTRVATITLALSGFVINPFQLANFTTNTLAGNTTVQIVPAFLNATTLAFAGNQALRGGMAPVSVTVTATDLTGGPGVGTIVGSPAVFNGGDTFKNLAFDPAVTGTSQIAIVPPTGFSTPSNTRMVTATVTAPAIILNNQLIGRNLQISTNAFLAAQAPAGGVQLTLTSGDATKILLSTSGTTQGTGEITFTIAQGGTATPAFFVQALDATGSTTLTASAPGFAPQVATMTLGPSGFVVNPFQIGNFTTTTLSGNTNIQITSALLNPTAGASLFNWVTNQAVRGGLAPVSVAVTATDLTGGPNVGTIVGSPVVFNGGNSVQTLAFDPSVAGTSRIEVVPPAAFNTPNNTRVITATVTAPAINLFGQTIGKDLQAAANVSLGAPAPTGGVQVTLTSGDASKVLLSTGATALGSGQITLPINQGVTGTPTFFIQALDSVGPVTVTASAPGYASQAATVTLAPSGFVVNPFQIGNFTTTTFSSNTSLQIIPAQLNAGTFAFAASQALRGGIAPVSVTVTATDLTGGPGVGAIVGSPAVFNGNDASKFLAFDPAAAGTSQIAVVPPTGFSTPTTARVITATVTAPAINIGATNVQVGRDLQQVVSISLGATPPSPVTVTVTVASTAIATLVASTNGAVAGGNTVTFTNVTSTGVGSFFVQGRAASGTTTITAQAPGYADDVSTVTAQPSGFTVNAGNFTTTTTAVNTGLQILAARLNVTTRNFEANQPLRGGVMALVPVTATDLTGGPGVGTITTSPVSFNGNVSAVNTQFDPAVAGTSRISVGVPAGFDTPSNSREITATVNP